MVLAVLLWRSKLGKGVWTNVCDEALLPYILQEDGGRPVRGLLVSGTIAAFLAIIALAGPTWQRLPAPAFRNASALVIALDLSRSMDAEDIKPSRLIRARYKIADILKQRKDGQTALLVYSGAAFTVTPLTDDTETIASQLSALTTDMMPSSGSNTVDAIDKAVTLFKQAGLQKGEVLLVTDGIDSESVSPMLKTLDAYHLSILGVGTLDGAPIPEADGGFVKDRQGGIVIAKLNVDVLTQLAHAGHGIYQTISADEGDSKNLLTKFEQTIQQDDMGDSNIMLELWDDKGPWLLLLVLPLAALTFRKGVLALAFCLLLPFPEDSYAFDWQSIWQTPNQQAQKSYSQQQFSEAAKQFTDPQWQAAAHYQAGEYDKAVAAYQSAPQADNADFSYNLGNSLAQAGQLERALTAYDQALANRPDDADARYNRDVVAKELATRKQQQEQQKSESGENKPDDKADGEGQNQNQNQGQDNQDQQSQQDSQGNAEKNGKPETKSERPSTESPSQNENPTQKSPEQQAKEQAELQAAREAAKTGQNPDADKTKNAAESAALETTEQQQADEQWLKRIPDDPSGLLKRKFKYQYKQMDKQGRDAKDSW
jgi:Ca-activated chloride channel family protein